MRLTPIGHKIGLVSDEVYEKVERKRKLIDEEINRLAGVPVGANAGMQKFLEAHGSEALKTGSNLAELIRRPELSYEDLAEIDTDRPELSYDVIEQININIKYEGYIKRQLHQVEQFKKLEGKKLSPDFDYNMVS